MIAAVDCGTNTIRLYVGDPPDAALRESRVVRLGQGVDATGELAPEALARTFVAVEEYAATIARYPVRRVRCCATSATRDARNATDFLAGVEQRLGVRPDVLGGAAEAALTFTGAVRGLGRAVPRPVLVVDVGGGSTELALGSADDPEEAVSLDVGSVRLAERFLHSDPAAPAELAALSAEVERQLDSVPFDLSRAGAVVGVAGTVTTVAAGVLGLPSLDEDALDGRSVPAAAVSRLVGEWAGTTVAERRAWGYMHPGRADVIVAGALVLERVLRRTGADALVVSRADILDGIAWSVAEPARRADH